MRHLDRITRIARIALTLLIALVVPNATVGQTLLVSGYNNDAVLLFDSHTGQSLGALPGVPGAQSVRYGPDGHLYVCAEKVNQVVRFDGQSLAPLGPFVFDDLNTPQDETGGLTAPTCAAFGPDGDLYVGSFDGDDIRKYDGQTGAYLGIFVPAGLGNLNGPDAGMVFGPDGDLYVPSFWSNRIIRYDGETGALIGMFAGPTQGVSRPRMLRFRSDGVLFVTSWGNGRILRFTPDGTSLGTFAFVGTPTGLVFDPANGDVLVTSDNTNTVRRFSKDGAAKGTIVAAGVLQGGTWLEYTPDPQLHLDRPSGKTGQTNTLSVTNGAPGGVALLLVGTQVASLDAGGCPPTPIGVGAPSLLPWPLDPVGEAHLSGLAPASLIGITAVFQVVEPGACRVSNLVVVTFE